MTVSDPRATRIPRRSASLPALVWALLILVLLSLPGSSFPSVRIWQPDKIAHLLLFGMQTLLLWYALVLPSEQNIWKWKAALTAWAVTSAFGALSEVYQDLATSRMMDPWDMLANVAGATIALLVMRGIGAARLLYPARLLLGRSARRFR